MKNIKIDMIIVIAGWFASILLSFSAWGVAPRTVERRGPDSSEKISPGLPVDSEDWYFSRFAVQLAPFAEMDLELIELKIQPYVELRFDRKQPK